MILAGSVSVGCRIDIKGATGSSVSKYKPKKGRDPSMIPGKIHSFAALGLGSILILGSSSEKEGGVEFS